MSISVQACCRSNIDLEHPKESGPTQLFEFEISDSSIYMYDPDSSDFTNLAENNLDGYRDFLKRHVYTWPLIKWK